MNFIALKVRKDNFMYLFYDDTTAIAFDPYDMEIIEKALKCNFTKVVYYPEELKPIRRPRKLKSVFVTHGHYDHNRDAHTITSAPVYSASNLADGDIHDNVLCIHTPCHTLDSYCYKIGDYLITGDTFFFLGVGKFFEGNGKMMISAIQKIMKLDENLIMLYGHDYSGVNIKFARQFLDIPRSFENRIFLKLEEEKKYNPFIQWEELKKRGLIEDLDHLRKLKDTFSIYNP